MRRRRSSSSSSRDLPLGEVNIIPIVDVSFCLVIFCLATMTLTLPAGINIFEAGRGRPAAAVALAGPVELVIDRKGAVFLNDKEVALSRLPAELSRAIAASREHMVTVGAPAGVPCERVVELLDLSRACGAARLALVSPSSEAAPS